MTFVTRWYVKHSNNGVYGPYPSEDRALQVSCLLYGPDKADKALVEVKVVPSLPRNVAQGILDAFFEKIQQKRR